MDLTVNGYYPVRGTELAISPELLVMSTRIDINHDHESLSQASRYSSPRISPPRKRTCGCGR